MGCDVGCDVGHDVVAAMVLTSASCGRGGHMGRDVWQGAAARRVAQGVAGRAAMQVVAKV